MSDYRHHRLHEVAEWLWVIADGATKKQLSDEQRVLLRLFGMIFDQQAVAVLAFERHWRGQASKADGFRLMRRAMRQHWPKTWRRLMAEHMEIHARREAGKGGKRAHTSQAPPRA